MMVGLIIGGIFVWSSQSSPKNIPEKTNEPRPNQPNNDLKKDLVNKIKTDLQARLTRVKNGSSDLSDIHPYLVSDNKISCSTGDLDFLKLKENIFPADIGTENYQAIVSLINQINQAREEWKSQQKQEYQKKAPTNPNLFCGAVGSTFDLSKPNTMMLKIEVLKASRTGKIINW